MIEDTASQHKSQWERLKPYQWKKGQSGNPAGGPKGQSMKVWVRNYLASLEEKERIKFLSSIDPSLAWKMGEGQPDQASDITSGGKPLPTPILNVLYNNGDLQNKPTEKTD